MPAPGTENEPPRAGFLCEISARTMNTRYECTAVLYGNAPKANQLAPSKVFRRTRVARQRVERPEIGDFFLLRISDPFVIVNHTDELASFLPPSKLYQLPTLEVLPTRLSRSNEWKKSVRAPQRGHSRWAYRAGAIRLFNLQFHRRPSLLPHLFPDERIKATVLEFATSIVYLPLRVSSVRSRAC